LGSVMVTAVKVKKGNLDHLLPAFDRRSSVRCVSGHSLEASQCSQHKRFTSGLESVAEPGGVCVSERFTNTFATDFRTGSPTSANNGLRTLLVRCRTSSRISVSHFTSVTVKLGFLLSRLPRAILVTLEMCGTRLRRPNRNIASLRLHDPRLAKGGGPFSYRVTNEPRGYRTADEPGRQYLAPKCGRSEAAANAKSSARPTIRMVD